ncbi:non-hydrolyzing UDP-N-acetylglucosamine 2-epimerase [Dyadobacter chenhuakuii]|uniref:UDP-N-acetylglucosamine 2-epimerase (Non-hydrolyzing) n=1 Tax=Dyadobacter chenhuakuii TaxID=2909339 RepID=A0ABY4XEK3_9BACT|nr:UDP-N-acetylglucosamine 2-epimerase (non-hydrolyzing) [Dyadobacter chenhuakuii]MCF2492002.1 UDP-N-acetylglucosamine 2-epimerase (non-hydrolyzing) [Dyadobacter chenhuakuii]USJ28837.1 UDP-N-acetylglucosamine 2-epimerase (non-hydrolyzing) [Dyadobacter chenhuakuii]
MKVINIVGARPNFMKVAPLHRAFTLFPDINSLIVHTGQHYDFRMSGIFFEQLQLPEPDYFLGVSNGSQAQQTAAIMVAFEKVLLIEKPDIVLVVGDVNSTLACALVAVKMHIPVVHVEAGLRSGDRKMPEEINRIVTDAIADQLFVTEKSAVCNLLRENISPEKIHFVGNVMIDSLLHCLNQVTEDARQRVRQNEYILMTMHRPANVDNAVVMLEIANMIRRLSALHPIIFPIHPRTLKSLEAQGLLHDLKKIKNLEITEPQGHREFLTLINNASLVITDSGGIQEETTFLKVPCITLRDSTERPITVEAGTNHLLPDWNAQSVVELARKIMGGHCKKGQIPELWDGCAADRIVTILREKYINSYVCAGKRQPSDLK